MRKSFKPLSIIFALLIVLYVSVQTANACSCAVNDTVDKDFIKTPNIAVFKLRSVEKYPEGEKGYAYGGIKQAKLTVERVFKGNFKVGQELTFAQGGGADCVWTFSESAIGQEFLFYLGDKPLTGKSSEKVVSSTSYANQTVSQAVWVAYTCSRSGSVLRRNGDIKYLENVAKLRDKTRLSGVLSQRVESVTEDVNAEYKLLSGYKISLRGGGKKIELKTDANGFYEIYDLPAGKYTVTPERIDGYKPFWGERQDSIEVEIKPKSHTEQNFDYSIDNRIRGRFFDTNGKPLKDVCLRLQPARGDVWKYFYEADCTDENGRFEITEIPIGTYVIVINDDGEITSDEPFGKFFYPNAVKREDAAEITIGAGDYRDDMIITAPTTAETITISGVLLYEDGKPVAEESVEFYLESKHNLADFSEDARAETDQNGRFQIRILKGQKGKLRGSMYAFEGEFENCPKLEKLIKAAGDRVPEISTPVIPIEAISDLTGIELRFPFPGCKKAKLE